MGLAMLAHSIKSRCASCAQWLRYGRRASIHAVPSEVENTGPLVHSDLEGIAKHLEKCKNVIVLLGAGVSVSAGIPDFRSPGTGLYDNLQQYGLPFAEAIFDLDFFKSNPWPFYTLCKELWPGQYKPTVAHSFISLLHQKGILRRCFTQNIDSLETLSGLPADKVVAAHGNFDSASCVATGKKVPVDDVREAVMKGKDACAELNKKHGGLVKPDIVFFGENLPARFFEHSESDFPSCDLLIVMGTSLQVHPFAGLIHKVGPEVPRILINRVRVGEDAAAHSPIRAYLGWQSAGFQFDVPNSRDVFYGGDCDNGVTELVKHCGWQEEFQTVLNSATLPPCLRTVLASATFQAALDHAVSQKSRLRTESDEEFV